MADSNTNVNLKNVDFNPFNGPQILHLAPATEPQMEIWAACQFGGNDANRAFNESVSLRFTGVLDHAAFDRAWREVIARHEALHSAFSGDGKQICVFDNIDIPLSYTDCSDKTEAQQEQIVDAYVKQDALYTFDLINGPLVKAGLLKFSDTAHHFTLTAHHIICDGWSLGIVLQDLGALYSAHVKNQPPALSEAPTYSQYAAEQAAFAKSEEHARIEKFWLDQYKDSVPVLDLPTDFTRPALRTYTIARRDYSLHESLAVAVKQLGMKAGCSFVTTLMAAFDVFLHRETGQNDLIVGLPTAGQSASGQLRLVGHCVNLLPLRSFPRAGLSFSTFLKQRKEAILNAFEHQQLTFSSLLKKLPITRDPARVPMVPVIFNVDMGLDNDVAFHGLIYKLISNPRQYGAVDLFLNISGPSTIQQAPLTFEWAYNTQLFKESTIDRMMVEFERLLEQIVSNPTIDIADIALQDPGQQNKKLAQWNNTQADYPKQTPLHSLLAKTAADFGDKVALVFNERSISYRELDRTANQLAHVIQRKGIGPGKIVGVLLDRSPEMLITLLAILKAGAAYVPIDPEYPQDRVAFMLADSSASLLITSKKYQVDESILHQANKQGNAMKLLALETVLGTLDSYPAKAPETPVTGDDLAYILYTSGSTGQPKGVLIEHHNLVNLLYSMITLPGISDRDVLLAVTTISFDIAGLELFLPLLAGATLVLADSESTKDGRVLLQLIPERSVSMIQATPATYKMMLAAGWEEQFDLKILCCGEPMSRDLAQRLIARCGSLWNMYGPTETTIYSTGKQILATDEVITIGRPIHNTQVYILDEHLNPVSEGIVGEIYIAGDGVARGYLNRPELTQEKFVVNPFSPNKADKMYRTGDLGKFLANGEIHCLGRIDHQVKIRGYRIELGEIEHALVTQSTIKDAVVIAREDRPGDQRLVAYLVTKAPLVNGTFLAQVPVWRTKLREVLPDYMVPTEFVSIPHLPITPNGKIDRKALPKPDTLLSGKDSALEEPVTDMEKLIHHIWADVLGISKVGIDHDFFELGGHSMIAVQMMTRLEKETGKRLPLSTLLTHPTIRKLAGLLTADEKPIAWKSLVPIKPEGRKAPIYIIHGIGLNLLNFSSLVSYMDPDQPIFGLQALGLDGLDEPLDNMEAIATHYLSEVLEQNPDGPYAIAGYSFGGYVALEMAQQLKAKGKEVKLLAMFDTNAQEPDSQRPALLPWLSRKIYRQFPKLLWFTRSFIQQPGKTLHYQQLYVERQVKAFLQKVGLYQPPQPDDQLDHLNLISEKHEMAFQTYTMKPYDGVIDLFKAKKRVYFVDDSKYLGWKKFALQGVRVHSVPGDHEMMLLPPNDKVFAETLQRALDNS